MIIAPYDHKRTHDRDMERFIKKVVKPAIEQNQDWIHLNVGMTGTGKTSLALYQYEDYDKEHMSIEFVALNRQDYAAGMKRASTYDGWRFELWDEADANKRDALSQFNKDTISMNWAVRGLRIFQIWDNPSAEWLDKPFVEEKINSMCYVLDKFKDRPRRYLFFTRKGILALLEERGNLKHETLRKYGPKYALYQGWFKKYNGPLWKEYEKKKQERMTSKVDEFFKKYADEETLNQSRAAKALEMTPRHWQRVRKELGLFEKKKWSKTELAAISKELGKKVKF
jgi:hypothetical protein